MVVRGAMKDVVSPIKDTAPISIPILGPLLSVPFAQGYKVNGALTGGRGKSIFKVTNLNDSGAGSLRQAVTDATSAAGGHIIFEVGGVIELSSLLLVGSFGADSNISIWGETAPPPGITILPVAGWVSTGGSNDLFTVRGNNVICSHIRTRMRPGIHNPNGFSFAVFSIEGSTAISRKVLCVNCSFSGNGDDECVAIADDGTDFTFLRCFFGPGSNPQCKNLLLTSWNTSLGSLQVALIRNGFFLTADRNPEWHSGTKFVRYNDYIYACGNSVGTNPACFQGFHSIGAGVTPFPPARISLRGVVYEGNGTDNRPQFEWDTALTNSSPHHELYFDDIATIVRCVEAPCIVDIKSLETDLNMVLPEIGSSLVLPSSVSKSHVLTYGGARPADRDAVDALNVTNASNGTGVVTFGEPPAYVLGSGSRVLSVPSNHASQAPGEAPGWTVFEAWLRQYTLAVGGS